MNRYSSEEIEKMRALRSKGHTLREIADLIGRPLSGKIHRHVRDIPPPNRKWRRGPRRDASKVARIIRLRNAGFSIRAICERVGCSVGKVHKTLHSVKSSQ
jgi:hypothetical protein